MDAVSGSATVVGRFRFRPVTEADARAIAGWRYPAPHDFYDLDPEGWWNLLDPAAGCVAVDLAAVAGPAPFDRAAGLGGRAGLSGPAGFAVFGAEARVRGAEEAGLYGAAALDVGLGLRPDLTGQGLGVGFVEAVLDYAAARFDPPAFRLSVAAFNERAIRTYHRVGFAAVGSCTSPMRGVEVAFLLMMRPRPDDRAAERASAAAATRAKDRWDGAQRPGGAQRPREDLTP